MKIAVRLVTAALVTGTAAIGFAPIARADIPMSFSSSVEAWYQPNPTCGSPAGCVTTGSLPTPPPTPVPTSPFPAGTMHVGYSAGQETARSYLSFPLSGLTGTVTSASLDVPLDVAQADGSLSPDSSKVLVCAVFSAVMPVEGSTDEPPSTECGVSVPAKYVPAPAPHLHADLSAFKDILLDIGGLALLPDATGEATDSAWRVVFSSHARTDAAKTPPATLTVSVQDASQPAAALPTVGQPSPAPLAPLTGAGFAAPPATAGVVASPPAVSPPVVASVPVSEPTTITVGYAYPVVWLLPLGFLILIPLAAKALTKDLAPALATETTLASSRTAGAL